MAKPARVPGLGPKSRLREAGPRLLARRLAEVRAWESALSLEALPDEAVHGMRVATRRLRATLSMLGLSPLGRELKQLQDALGAVRDLQLQRGWFGKVKPRALAATSKALAVSLGTFADDQATKVLVATPREAGRLGGHRLRRKLRAQLAALGPLMQKAGLSTDAHDSHLLRIAVKKLRYRAEVLEQALPGPVGALLEALEPLQESLGALHDLDVRIGLGGDVADKRRVFAAKMARELLRWREKKIARALRRKLR